MDPGCALGYGKGINVEERFPGGITADIRLEQRSPPQASLMLFVLGAFIYVFTLNLWGTQELVGAVVLEVLAVDRLEGRVGLQGSEGPLIVRCNPGKSLFALDFLQPPVGVLGRLAYNDTPEYRNAE
jgi:hypothetical protein